jgi:putative ABC transport system permease protein
VIGFQLKRTIKIGFKSLYMHTLRSVLTMTGITLGVCSVIAMLAIGTGASEEAQAQIRKLGSTNIIIQSVKPAASAEAGQESSFVLSYGLTYKDAERIQNTLPGVKVIVGNRKVKSNVLHGSRRMLTNIVGTVPWHKEVANMNLVKGRFLNAVDMNGRQPVAVLGTQAATTLFPLGDSLGSIVSDGEMRFRVIGVVSSYRPEDLGEQELQGDPNSEIYVPLTTMQSSYGESTVTRTSGSFSAEAVEISEMIVQAETTDQVEPLEPVIRHTLDMEHGDQQDYQIIVPLQLLEQARRTKRIFSITLGAIAAISLLVGGIGIMNISLATVVERTREIGIRRAMGAKRKHIVFQFLIETMLLSLLGGLLGIGMGIVVPQLVEKFAGMTTIVTPWSLGLAFGISVATGIIFGIYPAYRAAHMNPIEALRHE